MSKLEDFDIYYNGEKISSLIKIDCMDCSSICHLDCIITIKYVNKSGMLTMISDKSDKFRFKEKIPKSSYRKNSI